MTNNSSPGDVEQQPGHDGGREQAGQSVRGGDRLQNNNKCGGRTRNLELRTTQGRDYCPGHHRRVEPVLGGNADGHGQRHRQGQGDDTHHEPGQYVGAQGAARVPKRQCPTQRHRNPRSRPKFSRT